MEFSQVYANEIEEIKSKKPDFLTEAKNRGYICPVCNNGAGSTGDGVVLDNNNPSPHYKCFVCNGYFDIIDLYAVANNLANVSYPEKVKAAAEYYGIEINKAKEVFTPLEREQKQPPIINNNKDYIDFYGECLGNWTQYPQAMEYLNKRGISLETVSKCGVGFCPNWKHPKSPNAPASDRVILPNSPTTYTARAISGKVDKQYQKQKVGEGQQIFNLEALNNEETEVVFVAEGEFDTLSIIEASGINNAVGLGSTGNYKKLLEYLKEHPTEKTIVIALDNDEAGKEAGQKLAKGLQNLNISYLKAKLCGTHKDENEFLQNDRKAFINTVAKTIKEVTQASPDNVRDYLDNYFDNEIEEFKKYCGRVTGLVNLDNKAGGLFPALYVLAAGSSIGKTTLSLQIADNLAAAGEDVLFFSMEQSKLELITKSLARISAQIDKKQAVNSLAIRKGFKQGILEQAKARYYNTIGEKMNIIEGNFNCTTEFICNYVRRFYEKTKRAPVVFIDYLQIIQPDDSKTTKREVMDNAVTELRRLSRETNATVFVISAINRNNYLTPIDFESIKESGGIEYTADVVYGLQLSCLNDEIFDKKDTKIKEKRKKINEAKAENPRKIDLVCLKNRYGVATFEVHFEYEPQYDLYTPIFDNMQDFNKAMSNNKAKQPKRF